MEIRSGDVKAVCDLVGRAIVDKEADTVMVQRSGLVRSSEMHFCSGDEDWNRFIKARRSGVEYEAVDTAVLYSLLYAINAGQIPGRMVVRDGVPSPRTIDLSSMLEDISIASDIKFAIKQVQGLRPIVSENGEHRLDTEVTEMIKRDLQSLCKDDYGVIEARRLCSLVAPLFGADQPQLFVGANKEITSMRFNLKGQGRGGPANSTNRTLEKGDEQKMRRKR
jgi:hypothetical protein